ncbi:MAG: AbrB/MazE/SpoVT family DNA-binding domain-containing protein [Methanobacteriota archaeon]
MVLSVVKKWGNSYGIVLPIAAVRENNLSENDTIEVEIRRKVRKIPELFGAGRFLKGDAQKIKDEMRSGWDG